MHEPHPLPELEPPLLGRKHWIGAVAAMMVLVGLVLVLWKATTRPVEIAASIGDASAPFVGILTAAALAAAVWSIYLQRHAITVQLKELQAQRVEMAASRTALEEQTKAQTELAQLQLKQMRDVELRELRTAYAHWFAEARDWLVNIVHIGNSLRSERGRGDGGGEGIRLLQTAMLQVILLDVSSKRVAKVKHLSSPLGLPETGSANMKLVGERYFTMGTERLEELEKFQEQVANWFQTGEERPLV